MSAGFYEGVERIARHVVQSRATSAVGRVVATHGAAPGAMPADHAVDVELRESGLVLPDVPVAVGVLGFAALPAVGDLVLVVFADGDANAPIVAGRLYNPDQPPPEHGDGQLVFRTPAGQAQGDLNLVVEMNEPSIKLELPGGLVLSLTEGEAILQVGDMKLTLSGSGSGEAKLEAGSAMIRLKNGQSIEMSATEIKLKADAKIALESAQIEIKGSGLVDVSGGLVKLNS